MNKIDWKSKLTSRKFWAALIGFITPILTVAGMNENQTAQVAAIIMSGGTLIAYIIGEGLVDAAHAGEDDPIYVERKEEEDDEDLQN